MGVNSQIARGVLNASKVMGNKGVNTGGYEVKC